jgi:hypothetical protein
LPWLDRRTGLYPAQGDSTMRALALLVTLLPMAWGLQGQPAAPNDTIVPSTNIGGAQYPRITPDLYYFLQRVFR